MRALILLLALIPGLALADETCEKKKKTQFSFFLDMNNSPNELAAARERSAEECLGFVHITNKKELDQKLGEVYRKKDGRVPIVVVSGHSVNSHFSGTRFSFGFSDIEKMKKKYPSFGTDLETVLLWGCFTGNKKKLDRWQETFPNATSIIGYTGRSPLDEQRVGADFLYSLWNQRHLIHQGRNDAEVKQILDDVIPHMGGGRHRTFMVTAGASFYTCDDANPQRYYYFVDNIDTEKSSLFPEDKIEKSCDQAKDELPGQLADLERYWSGSQEPYASHHPGYKSRELNTLRYNLYPWFNQFEHCFEEGARLKDGTAVGLNEMVNLIFYSNIKGNFVGKYKAKIKSVRAILKKAKVGVPGLHDIVGASRADIMKADRILRSEETRKAVGKKNQKALVEFASIFHNVVANMDGRCADITWIDLHPKTATEPGKACFAKLP